MARRETELTTTEARQGVTPHVTRYVLLLGIVGAVAAMAAAWMYFAW